MQNSTASSRGILQYQIKLADMSAGVPSHCMTNRSNSENETIELDIARLYKDKGIIHIVYKDDAVVDSENIQQVVQARKFLSDAKPQAVLVDARKARYWTRESKDYSHSAEAMKELAAVAVVSKSQVMKIHITSIQYVYKPPFPLKYFTDINKALRWLEQFKQV